MEKERIKRAHDNVQQALFGLSEGKRSETHCNYADCRAELKESRFRYFCKEHNALATQLEIRPSTIPNAGEGLFACGGGFAADDAIDVYTGDILTHPLEKTNRTYLFQCGQSYCVDGSSTKSCMSRWANSSTTNPNARMKLFEASPGIFLPLLCALHDISPGSEILFDYGPFHPFPSS